jgi:hypothetical protein
LVGPMKPVGLHCINAIQTFSNKVETRSESANVVQLTRNVQEVHMALSDDWNNKLGFQAETVNVSSRNFLCLLYSTHYILCKTGNNLWSVPQLEKVLNTYCIENFDKLLIQSMEQESFQGTGLERLTDGGRIFCKNIQDYISLTEEISFYRERLETFSLSQILGATINI